MKRMRWVSSWEYTWMVTARDGKARWKSWGICCSKGVSSVMRGTAATAVLPVWGRRFATDFFSGRAVVIFFGGVMGTGTFACSARSATGMIFLAGTSGTDTGFSTTTGVVGADTGTGAAATGSLVTGSGGGLGRFPTALCQKR